MNKKLLKRTITRDEKTIIITDIKQDTQKVSDNAKIQDSFEEVMDTYAPAFEKLAKN